MGILDVVFLGIRALCQEVANRIHGLGIGQRIGPRGSADGSLIHQHDVGESVQPCNRAMLSGAALGIRSAPFCRFKEYFFSQRGFAGPGNPDQTDEQAEWKRNIDIFEIVFTGPFDGHLPARHRFPPGLGNRNSQLAGQILTGEGSVDFFGRSEIHDLATLLAGHRTDIQQKVALPDDLRIVLDDHQGVLQIL